MTKKPKLPKSKPFILPKALTPNQGRLINSIISKDMTIAIGSAGTGKSYLMAAYAAYFYYTGRIDRIILARPTVPVGRGLGFLPGELSEKLMPWVLPFINTISQYLSPNEVDCMLKNGKLEILAFDHIRGTTFDDAFLILDEGQNTTIAEAKALVTRIGQNSKLLVNGDITQSDLKNYEKSGLSYLIDLLGDVNNEELAEKVGLVEFDWEDCVRSPLCKLWLKAFQND